MNPIDLYESQANVLHTWVKGLNDAELDAHPVPGTWSVRQCVVHTLDSDLIATHRMRRIAAEEKPLLVWYDETLFAKVPAINAGPIGVVCDLFALNRRWTASFLRALPKEAFTRIGIHTARGVVSLAQIVDSYAEHVTHHEKFVAAKRAKLGKPLA